MRRLLGDLGTRLSEKSDRIIISHENLLASSYFGPNKGAYRTMDGSPFSPVDHLPHILDNLAPERDELHLILTVRRQPEWLASMYAQYSDREPLAGQRDFVKQARNILNKFERDPSSPLNFHRLTEDLWETLSPTSLTMLPLERFLDNHYREVLVEVTGISARQIHEVSANNKRNQRSESSDNWTLRRFRPDLAKTENLALSPILWSSFGRVIREFPKKSARSIHLEATLKEEILQKVTPYTLAVRPNFIPLGLPGYVSKSDH